MSHRQEIEAELGRCGLLASRLETNLKNVTKTLVTERNHFKEQNENKDKQLSEMNTRNVELKAINGCLERSQKLYEESKFKSPDSNAFNMKAFMEAATKFDRETAVANMYDHGSEAGSQQQSPRATNLSSSFNAPSVAAGEVVNVDDDDEHHTSRTSNHK